MTFDEAVEGLINTMLGGWGGILGRPLVVIECGMIPGQEDGWAPLSPDPAGGYEKRWREILDRADRDWINLRLFSADGGAVGILIEYFDSGSPLRAHPRVAVTYGGSLTDHP